MKTAIPDEKLAGASGGAIRPKYVSSFFCEGCGKTIYLSGVYTHDRAVKEHNEKEHDPKFERK